jgi:hypothetical protein
MGQVFLIDSRDVAPPTNDAPVHQISDRVGCGLIDELDQECAPPGALLQVNKSLDNIGSNLLLKYVIVHSEKL